MTKEERAEKARRMLNALGEEQANGGFNEFSQFCEEGLLFLTQYMSEEGLKYLMDRIESVSDIGLNRRQGLENYGSGVGVW